MSNTLLSDLIGKIKADHAEEFEAAKEGRPTNAFDGPPLPLENEYRVVVDSAEYKASKNSGVMQFVLTYEIQEPSEFAGRKVQDYHNPKPQNDIASEQLAKLFGAMKARLDGWGEDLEAFVKQFEGKSIVIALRTWGEDNDRYGVRWVNADYGQTLKTNVKPPKKKVDTSKLVADIVIPKTQEAEAPVQIQIPTGPPATPSAPATGGPKLPPGLGGN